MDRQDPRKRGGLLKQSLKRAAGPGFKSQRTRQMQRGFFCSANELLFLLNG
jgi:hypothetical protein